MKSYGLAARSGDRLRRFPVTRALALAPILGRRLWAVVVTRCPHCGGGHVHRTGDADAVLGGRLLRRCPATKLRYLPRIAHRTRAARSAVQSIGITDRAA